MLFKALPSKETLDQLLRYEPETGKLFWKERPVSLFAETPKRPKEITAKRWNSIHAGSEAFTYVNPRGYKKGHLLGVLRESHRVIFKMFYGFDPELIDHINGNRNDNRISNIRSVGVGDNARNRAKCSVNKSGVTGVCKTSNGDWQAYITCNKKQTHLGFFKDFHSAVSARQNAEKDFGFHKNHGKRKCVFNNHKKRMPPA